MKIFCIFIGFLAVVDGTPLFENADVFTVCCWALARQFILKVLIFKGPMMPEMEPKIESRGRFHKREMDDYSDEEFQEMENDMKFISAEGHISLQRFFE